MLTALLVAAAVVGLFLLLAALQPPEFRVVRTAKIAAPPAAVFAAVDELRRWEAWSPWAKLDPASTTVYEGPARGVGAVMAWSGDRRVGKGRMTITASQPDERIVLRLDFEKPFRGTNTAEFSFRAEDGGTVVSWSGSGRRNFACKAVGLLLNCTKMLAAQFDKGLAQLKAVVEAGPR